MYSIYWLIFIICFLQYNIVYAKHGRKAESKEQDENYVRHVIEEGVKPAIFGSNSYDPIKQVFEPIKNATEKVNKGGSTVAIENGKDGANMKAEDDESRKRAMRASEAPVNATTLNVMPVRTKKVEISQPNEIKA